MESIKEILEERQNYLLQWKSEKEKALSLAPEGSLRICNSGKRTQFYQNLKSTDCSDRYINGKEFPLVKSLAQKDYDSKVLHAIDRELSVIKKFSDTYFAARSEQVYGKLHKERQKLVKPIEESEEEFVHQWQKVVYEGKGFQEDAPEIYTMRGERVRSKSELIIADLLNREGIPYRYEYPIYLNGYGRVYPDFNVLNVKSRKEWYWEHLGMMDDLGYVEKALRKLSTYESNGFFPGDGLILTYETKSMPINQKQILRLIQQYL